MRAMPIGGPSRQGWRRARASVRGRLLRPGGRLSVAVAPWPVTLLLVAGHELLVMVLFGAGVVAAAALLLVHGWRSRRRQAAWVAAQQHAERVVEAVYEQWIHDEATRGQRQLERWRRTHQL